MLGLWEVGTGPQRMSLHLAFRVDLEDLLAAVARLRAANVVPLDFDGKPTGEPVVLAWMPAASLFFRDPDGNQLEFLSMLPDDPQPETGNHQLEPLEPPNQMNQYGRLERISDDCCQLPLMF